MSFVRLKNNFLFRTLCKSLTFAKPSNNSNINFLQQCRISTANCLLGEGILIRMPSLSPTMTEGKIVKWMKEEGDTVQLGDVLCDIETDKAVMSFELDEEGTLAKILVGTDADIKIGTSIALLAPEGEDWKTVTLPDDAEVIIGASAPAAANSSETVITSSKKKFGPSVRLLLVDYGIFADKVEGSGPHGELLKGDVLKHIQQAHLSKLPITAPSVVTAPVAATSPPTAATPPATTLPAYTDIEVTGMRRTIAKRLLQSKSTIAHSYCTVECRIDALLALRRQFKLDKVALSINDLLVKAVALALQVSPRINSVWQAGQLKVSPTIDISVAVATPSGLITPIVHDADRLGVKAISDTIRKLAVRAKENKLKPKEFQGGSFTISNLGMFGIKEFTAIINPPQCAILAVGGGISVFGPDGPETRMRATLSYDRLAVDDEDAERFLTTLRQILELPNNIILGASTPPPLYSLQQDTV